MHTDTYTHAYIPSYACPRMYLCGCTCPYISIHPFAPVYIHNTLADQQADTRIHTYTSTQPRICLQLTYTHAYTTLTLRYTDTPLNTYTPIPCPRDRSMLRCAEAPYHRQRRVVGPGHVSVMVMVRTEDVSCQEW